MGFLGKDYADHYNRYKYCEIKNIQDLKRAQIHLNHNLKNKEIQLKYEISLVKNALNPINYLNEYLSNIFNVQSIASYFMQGYRITKDFVSRFKKKNNVNEAIDEDDSD